MRMKPARTPWEFSRAGFIRMLPSLPIAFTSKGACGPRLIGLAPLDSPCKEGGESSGSGGVFAFFDSMLSAPDIDAFEKVSGDSIEEEIDGLNPMCVTLEEVLERGNVEALIGAPFLLGGSERLMPFAVIEKASGAVLASRAKPPMMIVT